MSEYASIRVTAKDLGLSETFLRRLRAQGKLPGFAAGNRWYVNQKLLLQMLELQSAENVGKAVVDGRVI